MWVQWCCWDSRSQIPREMMPDGHPNHVLLRQAPTTRQMGSWVLMPCKLLPLVQSPWSRRAWCWGMTRNRVAWALVFEQNSFSPIKHYSLKDVTFLDSNLGIDQTPVDFFRRGQITCALSEERSSMPCGNLEGLCQWLGSHAGRYLHLCGCAAQQAPLS